MKHAKQKQRKNKAAQPPQRRLRVRKPIYDWASVNWSNRDIDIAGQLGCSRERVRQMRHAMGKQRSPYEGQNGKSLALAQWLKENKERVAGATAAEIKRLSGTDLSRGGVYTVLKRVGMTGRRGPRPRFNYRDINWDLPTTDLVNIWGISLMTVSRYRRALRINSRWDKREAEATRDPAYRQAVARERQRTKAMRRGRRAA